MLCRYILANKHVYREVIITRLFWNVFQTVRTTVSAEIQLQKMDFYVWKTVLLRGNAKGQTTKRERLGSHSFFLSIRILFFRPRQNITLIFLPILSWERSWEFRPSGKVKAGSCQPPPPPLWIFLDYWWRMKFRFINLMFAARLQFLFTVGRDSFYMYTTAKSQMARFVGYVQSLMWHTTSCRNINVPNIQLVLCF